MFKRWRAWCHETPAKDRDCQGTVDPSPYYARAEFREDFFEFLRSQYFPHIDGAVPALSALLDYELALSGPGWESSCAAEPPSDVKFNGAEAVPRLGKGVHLIELGADYREIIERLRRKETLDGIPSRPVVLATRMVSEKQVDVLELSSLSSQLLRLCNGRRTSRDIIEEFSCVANDIKDIAPEKVCLFGLEYLRKEGLIA